MRERVDVAQNFTPVELSQLLTKVKDLKAEGYRFGQACATVVDDKIEIIYSFDKDYSLMNLKLVISPEEEVEMHDLFGIKFMHMELDYEGNFFKVAEPTPWNPKK